MKHTIVLVDDHPVFRQGLSHMLSKEDDLTIVGEADDGHMAIEQVRKKQPDLVVMDINMPNLDGIEATRRILAEAPDTRVVALSVHSGKQFVRDMIQAGASGYILKESIPEEMVAGIRTVLDGDIYLSQSISKVLVSDYKSLVSESEPEGSDHTGSILYTKLYRPPISANIIPRARLIAAIEQGVHNPITLIAAPAGYGKSILASGWLEVSELPGAWVSLDEGDNRLRAFLTYLIEAIGKTVECTELKIKSLVVGAQMPSAREAGQYLLNDLESCAQRFALVFDDYHLIRDESIHEFISELLVHPSPAIHLVLVTRLDPPLPLASLRARGMLTEITLADLRFTVTETKAYLERFLRISVTDQTAHILEEKIEGWVTGLHLAALSLRGDSDQERLIGDLRGTSLYVQEYLLQEVLAKAPSTHKRHLLQTAILDRFNASLCDALMPDDVPDESISNGREFVDWLITRHFFIIPLEPSGRWFRYHHLFQQLLQDQLHQRQRPEEIAGLHSRASDWFAKSRLVADAIKHAIAAGEPAKAAQVVEHNRYSMMNTDRWYVFESWLPMLPDDMVSQRPGLLMTRAWLHYHRFNILRIPPVIDAAEALLGDSPADRSIQGEIDFFRGYFYYFQNEGAVSLKHLSHARERVPERHDEIRGQIEILHGLAMQMQGQPEAALERLTQLLDQPRWEKSVARTRIQVTMVYIHILSGDLGQAAAANRQLHDFATRGDFAYARSWSLYLAGLIHFFRNELKDAIDRFSQAIEQKHILHTRAVIDSMAGLCLAYQDIGEPDQAEAMLQQVCGFVESLNDPLNAMLARSCRVRLAIMQGQPATSIDLLRDDLPPDENMVWWLEIPVVTYCRALIARGSDQSLEKSDKKLRELLELNQASHNTCHLIQVLILLALVCTKQDRVADALTFLERAVDLSAHGGWVRPFVEAGWPVANLLQRLRGRSDAIELIDRILGACEAVGPNPEPDAGAPSMIPEKPPAPRTVPAQPLIEPLTNRELDVLELLAQRLQNKEIADKLFITTETVKGHLKNIYQKLGVKKRRQAVEVAKRLKVI